MGLSWFGSYTRGVYFLFSMDCIDLIRRSTVERSVRAAFGQVRYALFDLVWTSLINHRVSTSWWAWAWDDCATMTRVQLEETETGVLVDSKKKLGTSSEIASRAFISFLRLLLYNHTKFIVINKWQTANPLLIFISRYLVERSGSF
jgi:hypothetical protein